jgi:hypothetical protein
MEIHLAGGGGGGGGQCGGTWQCGWQTGGNGDTSCYFWCNYPFMLVVVAVVAHEAMVATVRHRCWMELAVVATNANWRSRRLWHRNYQIHNLTMDAKIYRLYGIDTAMHLLRPGAKWEISNSVITKWDDPRPQPSMEEVREVMDKIQAFEDSINTVWLPEQIEELTGRK